MKQILCLHVRQFSKLENIGACKTLTASPLPHPTPPPDKRNTFPTYSIRLFSSHEIICSSLMYKEVIFTLIHFCKKATANYLVTRNPSRMYDQVLRDIPMCRSLIDPARTLCGLSVYLHSFDFSKLKSKG